jgi:hypothetical protein
MEGLAAIRRLRWCNLQIAPSRCVDQLAGAGKWPGEGALLRLLDDLGGEDVDLGPRISPGVGRQPGLSGAAVAQELLLAPAGLGGHLGQEASAREAALDVDAVRAKLHFLHRVLDPAQG